MVTLFKVVWVLKIAHQSAYRMKMETSTLDKINYSVKEERLIKQPFLYLTGIYQSKNK